MLGVTTAISAMFLSIRSIETNISQELNFKERVANNCKQVCQGFKTKPLLKTVAFAGIGGLLIPTFDEYMYVYILVELEFEKSIVAWLRICSWLGVVLGVIIFVSSLKK